MKSKKFTRSIVIIMIIGALIPELSFCELKTLNDDEMSKVDAKAAVLFDSRINKGHNKADKTEGVLNGYADLDALKSLNTCSGAMDCSTTQNNFFYPGNQAPIRYTAPMPSCRSGGCR